VQSRTYVATFQRNILPSSPTIKMKAADIC
jgi:hypothetical protein